MSKKRQNCLIPGCIEKAVTRRLCGRCYQFEKAAGRIDLYPPVNSSRFVDGEWKVCSVDGCDRRVNTRGFCTLHYSRVKRYNTPGPVGCVKGYKNTPHQEIKKRAALVLKQAGFTYHEIGACFGLSDTRAAQMLRPSDREWEQLLKRSGGKCEECGTGGLLHASHPPDYSGPADKVLCMSCHRKRDTPLTYLLPKVVGES